MNTVAVTLTGVYIYTHTGSLINKKININKKIAIEKYRFLLLSFCVL
mgnify:CR=1 FL=1